jgi:hypothetical protein
MFQWLNADLNPPLREDAPIPFAILKAIMAHLYLAWIHPFGDGNGRTARLLEFHILLEAGVPLPVAHLLSDHSNRTRAEYYRQLDRASKSGGDVLPFLSSACIPSFFPPPFTSNSLRLGVTANRDDMSAACALITDPDEPALAE